MNLTFWLLALACCWMAGCRPQASPPASPRDSAPPALTLEQVRERGIVSFVGELRWYRARIGWDYLSGSMIPEAPPDPDRPNRVSRAVLLVGAVFIEGGSRLTTPRDAANRQQYAFDGRPLRNGASYLLRGRLLYRRALLAKQVDLRDPRLVRQSNDPGYWGQTFRFELVELREAP